MMETQKEENYEQKENSGGYYVCVHDVVAASSGSIRRYNSRCTGWTVKDSGICSSRYYIKRRYAGDKKRRNNRGQCQLPMVS